MTGQQNFYMENNITNISNYVPQNSFSYSGLILEKYRNDNAPFLFENPVTVNTILNEEYSENP